jgi:glyoxylase-like metal-dependent hydrolase (beta-lactamase superfamily II)
MTAVRMRLERSAFSIMVAALALLGGQSAPVAQSGRRSAMPATPLPTWHVQGGVYLVAGAGANTVVQIGPLGVVVVDPGAARQADALIETIRALSDTPIRSIINTSADDGHTGGNERVAASGAAMGSRTAAQVGAGQGTRAEIIAHELVLNRMSAPAGTVAPTPVGAWPSATFSAPRKEFYTNDEGIQIVHHPSAHTDGDSSVFFRRSDVIAVGDVYSTVSFPVIDEARGGTIGGTLDALNGLLDAAISGEKTEGGTMIVPGHGRISDEADLVEYRDMVTIVRDRIAAMVAKGRSLDDVRAARPTMEYDALYGSATGWTSTQFVDAVYRTLRPAPKR